MHTALLKVASQWDQILTNAQGTVSQKSSDVDLLTAADTEVESLVRKKIQQLDSSATIVGEENGKTRSADGGQSRTYLIDPIDGTFNFARDSPHYCTAIACIENKEVIAAEAYFPAFKMSIGAEKGSGVHVSKDPTKPLAEREYTAQVSDKGSLSGAALNSDILPANRSDLIHIHNELTKKAIVKCQMCAVYSAYDIARGSLDGAIMSGLKPWDIAAGYLFVNEAGGTVSDAAGNTSWPAVRDSELTVLSNGNLDEKLYSALPS